jgi:hypothetical protein
MSEVQVQLAIAIEELNVRLNSGRRLLRSITVDCQPDLVEKHCNNSKFWEKSEGQFINKKLDLRLIKSTTNYRLNVYKPKVELLINETVNNINVVKTKITPVVRVKKSTETSLSGRIISGLETLNEIVDIARDVIRESAKELRIENKKEFAEKKSNILKELNERLQVLNSIKNKSDFQIYQIESTEELIERIENIYL